MSTKDTKKQRDGVALWKALKQAEIDDDLDEVLSMSDAELDGYINANGGDAAKIRERGAALGKELMERRARLEWQDALEKELGAFRATAAALKAAPREKLSRPELEKRLDAARKDPRFAAPVAALFRKKTAEAATDEELQALIDRIALLASLEEK